MARDTFPVVCQSVDRVTGGIVSELTVLVPVTTPDYAAHLCARMTEVSATDWRVKPSPSGPPLDTV